MTAQSRTRLDKRGWPESRIGQRAITLAVLSVAGIVLLVLGFALDIVEPADSYTDSWAQLVWGVGIWVCAVAALSPLSCCSWRRAGQVLTLLQVSRERSPR